MYYVLGDGGAKYGPADVPTLKQWAAEGRILPQMMLEDANTGAQLPAAQVPGLFDAPPQAAPSYSPPPQDMGQAGMGQPGAGPAAGQPGPYQSPGPNQSPGGYQGPQNQGPYSQNPYGSPYPRVGEGEDVSKFVVGAWVLSALSLLCCPVCLGPAAIFCAYKVDQAKHPQGKLLLGIAIGAMVAGIVIGAIVNMSNPALQRIMSGGG